MLSQTSPLLYLLLPFLPTLLATANPNPTPEPEPYLPFHVPIVHTDSGKRQFSPDLETRQNWLAGQGRAMRKKYAQHLDERGQEMLKRDDLERRNLERKQKRATGTVTMTDVGIDASYAGQVSIGTPAQNFLLILDTGSSDCWVADTDCSASSCQGISRFSPGASSTYKSTGQEFEISYGSGDASGLISQETIAMGGFTVQNQGFAVVNQTTSGLISSPLSGLMGLAWQSIAQTGATPFWQALAQSGTWTTPEMGVHMARFRGDASATQVESQGGELTLGGTDSSLVSGNINFISIPQNNLDYWRIPLQNVQVQGSSVNILSSAGNQPSTAIDTGTTLIAGPSTAIRAIYAAIPGSAAMSGQQYQGMWQYPCSTNVNISLQYGGLQYSISNQDMNLGSFTSNNRMCTGAFFEMNLQSNSLIQWIVGASFLKNVYSVFRANPAAIGFAALSGSANTVSNGTSAPTTGGGTSGPSGGSGSNSTGSGSGSGSGRSAAGHGATVALGGLGVGIAASLLASLL